MGSTNGAAKNAMQRELDALLRRIADVARLLPALTADNAFEERHRLVACIERGECAVPSWTRKKTRVEKTVWYSLAAARRLAEASPADALYASRLDELELDLSLIDALGDSRRVHALTARRFGTGAMPVPTPSGSTTLGDVARTILDVIDDSHEPRTLPAEAKDPRAASLANVIRTIAAEAELPVEVKVEPRLVAAAATGDRIVFIAQRMFGANEAIRLAVHEVLGHLTAAANGRTQALGLLEVGTAGSFTDQEGLAIWLEEQAGVLDGRRLRTLAARVLAADHVHAGATFGDTARELVRLHGFPASDAVSIAERAYRGGGVARDVVYLHGWLRVRSVLERGSMTVDELRSGRIGVADVVPLRALAQRGLVYPPRYRPSLARSLRATLGGTSLSTSPPSAAASFTRFELT